MLSTQRLEGHNRHNPDALRRAHSESMTERLVEGASWAKLASAMHPEE